MKLNNIKRLCCISNSVIILLCALSMSGCDRGPKSQKAQAPPSPTVVPATPVAPVAPTASKTTELPTVPPTTVDQKYVGKYLNKKYPKDFTDLKSDGTFLYKEANTSLSGKYAIQGNKLLLALPDGSGSISKIDDKGIIDSKGELWTKK